MHRGTKYIITFFFFWLAVIGYITMAGISSKWDCDNVKKGIMEVTKGGTLGPGYGNRNNLIYYGQIVETGERVRISPRNLYKVHPMLQKSIDLTEKFRNGDTTFLVSVYYENHKTSLDIPKDCIQNKAKATKMFIIRSLVFLFLLLPLSLWIIINLVKYIKKKRFTVLLLSSIFATMLAGQEVLIQ